MIKITWWQYWAELKKFWIAEFHVDLIKMWLKAEISGWGELITFMLVPAIIIVTWLMLPVSYPIFTYLRVLKMEIDRREHDRNWKRSGIMIPVPDIGKADIVRLKLHGDIGRINRAEIPDWKQNLEYKVWQGNEFNNECVDLIAEHCLEIIRIHKSRLVLVRKAEQ